MAFPDDPYRAHEPVKDGPVTTCPCCGHKGYADGGQYTEPISSITDGWVLKDGGQHHDHLYLFVRCADGTTRTAFIPRNRSPLSK